MNQNNNNNIRM